MESKMGRITFGPAKMPKLESLMSNAPSGSIVELSLQGVITDQAKTLADVKAQLADLRDRARKIYAGFESESMNGVVCSIPDTGIDTAPHRTWCRRCQARYRALAALAEAR